MFAIENKQIVKGVRKSEIKNDLVGFSRVLICKEIVEVIVELRCVSEKEAKDVKTLYPSEVEEVKKRFA